MLFVGKNPIIFASPLPQKRGVCVVMMMKMMMIPLRGKIATSPLKEFIPGTLSAPPPPHTPHPTLPWISQFPLVTPLPFNRHSDISFCEVQMWLVHFCKKKRWCFNVGFTVLLGYQKYKHTRMNTHTHSPVNSGFKRKWDFTKQKNQLKSLDR